MNMWPYIGVYLMFRYCKFNWDNWGFPFFPNIFWFIGTSPINGRFIYVYIYIYLFNGGKKTSIDAGFSSTTRLIARVSVFVGLPPVTNVSW